MLLTSFRPNYFKVFFKAWIIFYQRFKPKYWNLADWEKIKFSSQSERKYAIRRLSCFALTCIWQMCTLIWLSIRSYINIDIFPRDPRRNLIHIGRIWTITSHRYQVMLKTLKFFDQSNNRNERLFTGAAKSVFFLWGKQYSFIFRKFLKHFDGAIFYQLFDFKFWKKVQ